MANEEAKKAAQKEVEKRLAPMMRALNTVREVNDKGRQAVQAWADSNTRPAPAATDTGLETVGYTTAQGENYATGCYLVKGVKLYGMEAVVARSQAEELLGAERAEKEKLEAAWLEAEGIISDLKADNAAKDVRIKELDDISGEFAKDVRELNARLHKLRDRAEAAEAKLAAAEKERDHWKEYSSGQGKLIESGVFVKNDEYIRLTALEAKLAAYEKALDIIFKNPRSETAILEARAVLGGKPS